MRINALEVVGIVALAIVGVQVFSWMDRAPVAYVASYSSPTYVAGGYSTPTYSYSAPTTTAAPQVNAKERRLLYLLWTWDQTKA